MEAIASSRGTKSWEKGNINLSFFWSQATYLSFESWFFDSTHHTLHWIFTFNEVAGCRISLLSLIKFYWLLGHSINRKSITNKWKSCPEATGMCSSKEHTMFKHTYIYIYIYKMSLPLPFNQVYPSLRSPCKVFWWSWSIRKPCSPDTCCNLFDGERLRVRVCSRQGRAIGRRITHSWAD